MVYTKVAREPKLEHPDDRKELDILQSLLRRYNFNISYFSHDEITFYDTNDIDDNDFVPVNSRYCMSRREFSAFVKVIKRLDASETRANQLMIDWAKQHPHFPRM